MANEAQQDAIRELIRVSKSAGMNAASDFGYLPSQQQADEAEISEAVQSVYAAIEAAARDEGRQEAVREIRDRLPGYTDDLNREEGHGYDYALRYIRSVLDDVARHGRSSDPTEWQGYSPTQPGNTYWRDTPMARAALQATGEPTTEDQP